MTPVDFPEANDKLAKSQPQYRPLPVSILHTHPTEECKTCMGKGLVAELPDLILSASSMVRCPHCNGAGHMPIWKEFTCKYELNEFELAQINLTKSIYFTQSGYGFNPILPQVENHFKHYAISYKIETFEHSPTQYTAWVPLETGKEFKVVAETPQEIIDMLLRFEELTPENIYFYERSALGIDEAGNITEL